MSLRSLSVGVGLALLVVMVPLALFMLMMTVSMRVVLLQKVSIGFAKKFPASNLFSLSMTILIPESPLTLLHRKRRGCDTL